MRQSLIENFKNSKRLEPSKHKKHDQIWTKIITPQSNNHEKTNKKGGKKKKEGVLEGYLLFSFLFFCLFSHGCLIDM